MHKVENNQKLTAGWILFAFGVWVYAFRGFLSSKLDITYDAISYYDHTRFFVENLIHGVYPLWDPFWYHGAPNDFFLRRIGALNPFYLVILVFKAMGVPYLLAYLWFLAGYYWGGMIAFYLLAMRIYHDRFLAYAGYLILLFSALGTRLFDSYMMLVTVPLIWFFYFLVAFAQTPRKHFFLGMMLSLMILAGTYIPFYFLIILCFFLVFFFLVYFDILPALFGRVISFINKNKLLVFLSLIVFIVSFLPAILFFYDTVHGVVALPFRHGNAGIGNPLIVSHKALDWGAVEDLIYSAYFSDLRMYNFAIVYVPFFSIIVLILGFIGRINRRLAFIFLLGVGLFCCIVPHGLPFYDFFYKHLFFLKFFRNLHFFIWFFLIPLFVLLVLEHWKMFTEVKLSKPLHRYLLLIYVLGVHGLALLFVWWWKDAVLSTYVMIALSFFFWALMALGRMKGNWWGFILLTLTVVIQPLEVYYYLSLKSVVHTNPDDYNFSYQQLQLRDTHIINPGEVPPAKIVLYYASSAYNNIYQNISNYPLEKYLQNKFILVDHVVLVGHDAIPSVLENNFLLNANFAVVDLDKGGGLKLNGNDPDPAPQALRINDASQGFKLLGFDANHVRLSLDLPYEKFLIYNDSFDPNWQVTVNHAPRPLYEVNGAFKGTWLPAGKCLVEFSYGHWWQYVMNVLLSLFALMILLGVIWYAWVYRLDRV